MYSLLTVSIGACYRYREQLQLQQPQKKQSHKYNALGDLIVASATSSKTHSNDDDDDDNSSSEDPTSSPSPISPATTSPSSPAAVRGVKKSIHPNPFASIEPPPVSRHRCTTLPGGSDVDAVLNSGKGPASYDDLISVSTGQPEHLNKQSQPTLQSARENSAAKVAVHFVHTVKT